MILMKQIKTISMTYFTVAAISISNSVGVRFSVIATGWRNDRAFKTEPSIVLILSRFSSGCKILTGSGGGNGGGFGVFFASSFTWSSILKAFNFSTQISICFIALKINSIQIKKNMENNIHNFIINIFSWNLIVFLFEKIYKPSSAVDIIFFWYYCWFHLTPEENATMRLQNQVEKIQINPTESDEAAIEWK